MRVDVWGARVGVTSCCGRWGGGLGLGGVGVGCRKATRQTEAGWGIVLRVPDARCTEGLEWGAGCGAVVVQGLGVLCGAPVPAPVAAAG